MTRYIARRLFVSVPVLIAIALATFLLIQTLPGGPFSTVGLKSMPESMRLLMERRYGLDRPLPEQFLRYMGNLLRGDLGPMLHTPGQTVNDVVARTLPVSIQLGLLSLAVPALGIGVGHLEPEEDARAEVEILMNHLDEGQPPLELTLMVASEYEKEMFARLLDVLGRERSPSGS